MVFYDDLWCFMMFNMVFYDVSWWFYDDLYGYMINQMDSFWENGDRFADKAY